MHVTVTLGGSRLSGLRAAMWADRVCALFTFDTEMYTEARRAVPSWRRKRKNPQLQMTYARDENRACDRAERRQHCRMGRSDARAAHLGHQNGPEQADSVNTSGRVGSQRIASGKALSALPQVFQRCSWARTGHVAFGSVHGPRVGATAPLLQLSETRN